MAHEKERKMVSQEIVGQKIAKAIEEVAEVCGKP
jgi:hypothetical protein